MCIVRLFHLTDVGAMPLLTLGVRALTATPEMYCLAGEVEVEDSPRRSLALNAAWAAAQNLDTAWGDGNQRSTMVGDVMEVEGTFYCVESERFTVLPAAGQAAFRSAFPAAAVS